MILTSADLDTFEIDSTDSPSTFIDGAAVVIVRHSTCGAILEENGCELDPLRLGSLLVACYGHFAVCAGGGQ